MQAQFSVRSAFLQRSCSAGDFSCLQTGRCFCLCKRRSNCVKSVDRCALQRAKTLQFCPPQCFVAALSQHGLSGAPCRVPSPTSSLETVLSDEDSPMADLKLQRTPPLSEARQRTPAAAGSTLLACCLRDCNSCYSIQVSLPEQTPQCVGSLVILSILCGGCAYMPIKSSQLMSCIRAAEAMAPCLCFIQLSCATSYDGF